MECSLILLKNVFLCTIKLIATIMEHRSNSWVIIIL